MKLGIWVRVPPWLFKKMKKYYKRYKKVRPLWYDKLFAITNYVIVDTSYKQVQKISEDIALYNKDWFINKPDWYELTEEEFKMELL